MASEPNNNHLTRSVLPFTPIQLEMYEAPPGAEKLNVIKLEDLEQYVKSMKESNGFKEQYQILRNGPQKPWTAAQTPENKNKNRYGDLLPYDDCRVVLEKYKNDPSSTYINASYVDCYDKKKAFICTQGPLEKTIGDFWRMIWQENVHVIAMTANIVESGKKKCEKYWPDKVTKYDDISVTFSKEEVYLEYVIRTFKIQRSGTSSSRVVRQYQYMAWPDHGVPTYPLSLLYLLQDIEAYQSRQQLNTSPIVLHCSAGVGRSGTVALLASSLKMLAAEGKVDVVGLLYKIRQQRVNLIETVEQFRFVYESLVENYFGDISRRLAEETVVYFNKLRQLKMHEGKRKSGLQLQFEALNSLNPLNNKQKCFSASTPANAAKNRSQDILPPDDGRPILKTNPPSNYINAVYVHDYGKVNQFIITQFPLPNTITDFWQMVYDAQSSTIVVLNELRKNDETSPAFWPQSGSLYYGNFKLECQSMDPEYFNGVLIRKLKLRNAKGSLKSRTVKMFHLHGWMKEDFLPPQIETLVQLYNKVRHWHKKTDGKPIVITCYDGCKASGFYCVASVLAKQVKESEYVDVFHAVRTVRLNRPAFIPTVDQYRWLYELACLLVNSKKILK